ncbi:MAG: DinB family protein [Gemmatimonadales bacterium]
MLARWLTGVLTREVRTLIRELAAYPDEKQIWATPPGVSNSAGTLALHLAGNLNHFVGGVLGGSGYRRDRDAEFARHDVPRAELERELESVVTMLERVLPTLDQAKLDAPYPAPPGGYSIVTGDFLVHLASHLAYHIGQLDYHRRLITGSATSVGPQSLGELATSRKG